MKTRRSFAWAAVGAIVVLLLILLSSRLHMRWRRLDALPAGNAIAGRYHFVKGPTQILLKGTPVIELGNAPASATRPGSKSNLQFWVGEEYREFSARQLPSWWDWNVGGSDVSDMHDIIGVWRLFTDLGTHHLVIKLQCDVSDGKAAAFEIEMWPCDEGGHLMLITPIGDPDNGEFVVFEHD
jgi:hypothetical protein